MITEAIALQDQPLTESRPLRTYLDFPHKQVVATLALLKHFRAFLASKCDGMRDPLEPHFPRVRDKAWARRKLNELIDVAICRKGSIDMRADDQRWIGWKRDQQALANIKNRIRVYQFESDECRSRFGHLLSRYDD